MLFQLEEPCVVFSSACTHPYNTVEGLRALIRGLNNAMLLPDEHDMPADSAEQVAAMLDHFEVRWRCKLDPGLKAPPPGFFKILIAKRT